MSIDSSWTLDDVRVARQCPADWNKMTGDDRVRFCQDCKLNVYNFTEMSRKEAEALVQEKEGQLCVRFYRRQDGTLLTKDCPLGTKLIIKTASAMNYGLVWAVSLLAVVCVVFLGKDYVTERLSLAISSAFSKVVGQLESGGCAASSAS